MSDLGSAGRGPSGDAAAPPAPTRRRGLVAGVITLALVAGVALGGIVFPLWSRLQPDDARVADTTASAAPSPAPPAGSASVPAQSPAGGGTAVYTAIPDLCDTLGFGPTEALLGPAERDDMARSFDVHEQWEDGTVEATCAVRHGPSADQALGSPLRTLVAIVVFPSADHVTPFGEDPAAFYRGTIRAREDAGGKIRKARGLGQVAHSYHDPAFSEWGVTALDQNLVIRVAVPDAADSGASRRHVVAAVGKVLDNAKKELRT